MKNSLIVFCVTIYSLLDCSGQDLIFTNKFSFVGYKEQKPVFKLFDLSKTDLYTLEQNEFGAIGFRNAYRFKNEQNLFFIHEEISATLEWNRRNSIESNKLNIFDGDSLIASFKWDTSRSLIYSPEFRIIIVAFGINGKIAPGKRVSNVVNRTVAIDLENGYKTELLPLHVSHGFFVDEYLYFSAPHVYSNYSPFPNDIFRVKIGDWNNPEMVFESHTSWWYPYPNLHLVATDVKPKYDDGNMNQVFYNATTKSYALSPDIQIGNTWKKPYLKYDGEYYQFYTVDTGIEGIQLRPLPTIPNEFPLTDSIQIYPREVWYNVPLSQKTFPETFITPYLLREADTTELVRLEKSQLRLLRNALYAQQGYLFKSEDLKEFFNQYEWYRMMTAKTIDNEGFVMLESDEDRAKLILEIENSK